MRVLVVDDHPELRALVGRALQSEGHAALFAASIAEADRVLGEEGVDLIVLDLALGDGWGAQWCKAIRTRGADVPLLILSAHSAIEQRLEGFDAGADDFLAKPFAVAELRHRIRALGRRRGAARSTVIERGAVRLDFAARRATRHGDECPITAREWSLLDRLALAKGNVVSRGELLEEVWGEDNESSARSLDVLVARIRKKLGAEWIRTVRGGGYALGE
ncbi:MAG: response regulator transcription factor [Myxococcales bacterium]|nr:response regulator transcription factor [Myxococcales bacterium]